MLYKILWEKEKYVILPLNFDLLKFYLAEKNQSWSILKPKWKGKNQSYLFCMAKPFCYLCKYCDLFFSFLFRILLKKF